MANSGYYPYEPSKAGATVAMLLFGSSAFVHLWQILKARTWFFTAFLIGAFSYVDLRLIDIGGHTAS